MVVAPRSLVVLALIVVATHAYAGDAPRSVTEPYVGGLTFVGGNTATRCLTMANAADVCFDVFPGDSDVHIVVEDVSGLPVGAAVKFYDSAFGFVGASGLFCGAESVLAPPGARYLVVYPQYVVSTVDACGGTLGQGAAHGAKAGFVTATFV